MKKTLVAVARQTPCKVLLGAEDTSAGTIADWYRRAQAAQANLLLNVGPDRDGLIPEYNRHFLRRAARELGLA